jgi:uncharacterized protein YjbI with pentapeptide repeats
MAKGNYWKEVDLSGANLSETDLSGAILNYAWLKDADCRNAKLDGARLTDAYLQGADLSGATFLEANLIRADLRQAKLIGARFADISFVWPKSANLSDVRLEQADLSGADLSGANLFRANLRQARLTNAHLADALLIGANLEGANLSGAILTRSRVGKSNLSMANLKGAVLIEATFVETKLIGADLSGAQTYGISVWDIETNEDTKQDGLIITKSGPVVTVDNLEIAQFIYLLLNRQKLRNAINTITSKAVLILGRFAPERKAVLDAMADELRKHNLVPIIFDFERSTNRDFTETIKVLAGISLFVIADITKPKSSPLELQATVPDYQIPFVPIIQDGEEPFSMFRDLWRKYEWVLQPVKYKSLTILLQVFKQAILDRAWEKHKELERKKMLAIEVLSAEEFLKEKDLRIVT